MLYKSEKERILIIGGSGFIGNSLFRELQSFFDVHATFCKQDFSENQVFHQYNAEKDSLISLLDLIKPTIIISVFKASLRAMEPSFEDIIRYVQKNSKRRILFLSSEKVFDAKFSFPAFEKDIPLAVSEEGKSNIVIEKLLLEEIPNQTAILRLPLVLGINSPEIFHLRQCIRHHAAFEVFPNLIISANTIDKVCLQIHFIINQKFTGIFHLASNDMIHHDELFKEITQKLGDDLPIFKNVYTSNDDRYHAILPKYNLLPKSFQISIDEVIEASALSEEILFSI